MQKATTERLFWFSGWAYDFSKYATGVLIIGLIVHYFFFSLLVVRGDSMIPNYRDGQIYIIDKIHYRLTSPQRGEAIAMFFPGETQKHFIKRVIGLPGEMISVRSNQVYINNQLLAEPYLMTGVPTGPDVERTLGPNEYFVMGDNRSVSSDSRAWGPVPANFIIGRIGPRLFSLPSQSPN
jgi:signal peptidase I